MDVHPLPVILTTTIDVAHSPVVPSAHIAGNRSGDDGIWGGEGKGFTGDLVARA